MINALILKASFFLCTAVWHLPKEYALVRLGCV